MTVELFRGGASVSSLGGLDFDTVLALVATFLALSVAVEVLQEIYKFVTTSKARSYRIALRSFLGPWVDEHYGSDDMSALLVRGPFHFLSGVTPEYFKQRTPAHLLPLGKDELIRAIERTALPVVRDTINALRHEADLQGGTPGKASPMLRAEIETLWSKYNTDTHARRVFDFLETWKVAAKPRLQDHGADALGAGVLDPVDAATTLDGLCRQFLPNREIVARDHEQFVRNFEHAYRRRNLRHTMILSFVLVMGLGLPLDHLYRRAAAMTPEELAGLVASARALTEESALGAGEAERATPPDSAAVAGEPEESEGTARLERLRGSLRDAIEIAIVQQEAAPSIFERGWEQLRTTVAQGWARSLFYIANCLLTSVFIAFGAPFWHGILEALFRLKRSQDIPESQKETA